MISLVDDEPVDIGARRLRHRLNVLRYDRSRFKHYIDTYTSLRDMDDEIDECVSLLGDDDAFAVDDIAEPVFGIQGGRGKLTNVHPPTACHGRACVIHNPSDHHMRDWPTNWRADTRVMERTCPHGVGHPDPDDVAYHKTTGNSWRAVHGCDGCC